MGTPRRRKPNPNPPCESPLLAEDRAGREALARGIGHVEYRFRAMIGDEAQAAYARTYVNEYRRAWDKSWPGLCEMLDIIEKEHLYSKPWMKDGIVYPTYESFEAYCEAEVEPFVGPIASLREQYRRFKNGEVDIEGGAKCLGHSQVVAGEETVQKASSERRNMELEQAEVTGRALGVRVGITKRHANRILSKVGHGLPTVGKPCPTPTKQQRASALGVSREQLRRIECIEEHRDLRERTELPQEDPRHLTVSEAYRRVRERKGILAVRDPIEPIWTAIMKLDEGDLNRLVERYNRWKSRKPA